MLKNYSIPARCNGRRNGESDEISSAPLARARLNTRFRQNGRVRAHKIFTKARNLAVLRTIVDFSTATTCYRREWSNAGACSTYESCKITGRRKRDLHVPATFSPFATHFMTVYPHRTTLKIYILSSPVTRRWSSSVEFVRVQTDLSDIYFVRTTDNADSADRKHGSAVSRWNLQTTAQFRNVRVRPRRFFVENNVFSPNKSTF